MAVIEAVRVWRPYLLGRKFRIITDKQPLKHMLEQRIITPEQQKFMARLMGFKFENLYHPGRHNTVADALSHKIESPEISAITGFMWSTWEEIGNQSIEDQEINMKRQQITNQGPIAEDYEWREGLLFFKGKVFVPIGGSILMRKN